MLDQGIDHRLGVLAVDLGEHHVARVALYERCELAIVATEQQIAFSVTRHGPVFNRGGALTDRYRVGDPAVNLGLLRVMTRATHRARAPQVLQQLFLQGASSLNEETAIDRLV